MFLLSIFIKFSIDKFGRLEELAVNGWASWASFLLRIPYLAYVEHAPHNIVSLPFIYTHNNQCRVETDPEILMLGSTGFEFA